jgi:hypothetical protein
VVANVLKLDRLSRDAHFLLGLETAGVAVDMPNANRLTVRLMRSGAAVQRACNHGEHQKADRDVHPPLMPDVARPTQQVVECVCRRAIDRPRAM